MSFIWNTIKPWIFVCQRCKHISPFDSLDFINKEIHNTNICVCKCKSCSHENDVTSLIPVTYRNKESSILICSYHNII